MTGRKGRIAVLTFGLGSRTMTNAPQGQLAPVRRFRCESVRDLGQDVIVTKTRGLAADRKGRQPIQYFQPPVLPSRGAALAALSYLPPTIPLSAGMNTPGPCLEH